MAANNARVGLAALLSEVLVVSSDLEGPGSSATDRARALFLRGRLQESTGAMDAGASGAKTLACAEEALKKAAKLDPGLDGAWNCLAQLLWKKGNLDGAKSCYQAVLNRGPNKKTLQAMSMLFRSLAKSKAAPGTDEQKNYIAESMVYAKAAVKLDLTDGYSWYQVGTAYMSAFFAEGASDRTKLAQALKAYENAERGGPNGIGRSKGLGLADHPDLHFNRAIVYRYVEDYGAALESFAKAAALDPNLPVAGEVDAVTASLAKLDDGCRGVGTMFKSKRLATLRAALLCGGGVYSGSSNAVDAAVPKEYEDQSLAALAEGTNEGVAVRVRIAMDATAEDLLNLSYVVVDKDGVLAALSVYGLEDGAIRQTSTLTLLRPNVRDVDATRGGRRFRFRLIRIDLPKQILVGGQMPVGRNARPRMASTNM